MPEPECGELEEEEPELVLEPELEPEALVGEAPLPIVVKVVQSDDEGVGWADGVIGSTTCVKVEVPYIPMGYNEAMSGRKAFNR